MRNDRITADTQHRSFHVLDGLRGVAAAAVVALHNAPAFTPLPIRSGYLAVDLFFLMSGFVIASAYDQRLAAGMSSRAFLRVRLIRLYPLYALALAAMVGSIIFGFAGMRLADWSRLGLAEATVAALAMLPTPGLRGGLLFPLNVMSWSLFFELAFNWLHAATFSFLRGRLPMVVAAFGAALLAADARYGMVDWGVEWPGCLIAVPRTGFSFFLGVLLFRLSKDDRLPRLSVPAPLLLVATLAILMLGPDREHRAWYDATAVFVAFPLLLCAAVTREPARPRIYTMLGEASYAAYILQAFLIPATLYAYRLAGIDVRAVRPWGALGVVAIVMVIGWVAGITLDPWMRRQLAAWLNARSLR